MCARGGGLDATCMAYETTTIYLAPADQKTSSPTPVQSQSSPSPVLVLDTAAYEYIQCIHIQSPSLEY